MLNEDVMDPRPDALHENGFAIPLPNQEAPWVVERG